jgi:hypothetical protein
MDMEGWKGDFWRQDPDPFTIARDKAPVMFAPGTAYLYSNPGMAMLSYAITASYRGTKYHDTRTLLRERIMEPIGIKGNEWSMGYGKTFQADGLELVANWGGSNFTPRAVARLGRLMLRKGNWEGTQLIDSSVVDLVTHYAGMPIEAGDEKHPAIANGPPWYVNYNGMWPRLPREAFFGAGAGNQFLMVIPGLNMIVVRNGDDMYDPTRGEGFYYGLVKYLVIPLMDSYVEPPYPVSDLIEGIEFAMDSAIIRKGCGSDNWPLTWGDDDNLYSAYGDGRGFEPYVDKKLSLGLAKISGTPGDFHGINIRSETGEQTGDGRTGKKASGILMVNKVLYMWIRNVNHNGEGSQLAWSKDHGTTWTFTDWIFPESFGSPAFLEFAKNYQGARDNFVYIYSHDEKDAYKPADRMVLARVPKNKITEKDAYEFYAGSNGQNEPLWTSDIGNRSSVFNHPAMCYRSGISYNPGLKRFLLCLVHPDSNDPRGSRFQGGFGIYESPEPWGPWKTVYYTRNWDVGPGESMSIPTKWMSKDGKTCYVVFSGNDCFSVREIKFKTR